MTAHPGVTPSVLQILDHLRPLASTTNVRGMARFGMTSEGRLGISMPQLRLIARKTGTSHPLALALWKTAIPEARILASMIADPQKLTKRQMEDWVKSFNSWDVCDQVCLNLFVRSPYAWKKVREWSVRKEEYVRRAAFALLACLAVHDRKSADRLFAGALSLVARASTDNRNYVKKAVSWALRGIGKRGRHLNTAALETARIIRQIPSTSARWIAGEAIRELENPAIRNRIKNDL
jgi:3-methyladenine DNA glycosylase AlkD